MQCIIENFTAFFFVYNFFLIFEFFRAIIILNSDQNTTGNSELFSANVYISSFSTEKGLGFIWLGFQFRPGIYTIGYHNRLS